MTISGIQQPRRTRIVAAVVVVACGAAVALALTAERPLTASEAALAASAEALAHAPFADSTLFVPSGPEFWYQPLAIHPTALLLRLGISREFALAAPAAAAGVLTIGLTGLLAARTTGQPFAGAWAAVLMLAVPAFIDQLRTPASGLSTLPPVLVWLLCVLRYIDRQTRWWPFIGGAALGISIYTQPQGVLSVPVYFVVGAFVLSLVLHGWRAITAAAAGVTISLVPAAIWLAGSPAAYRDTFGRWAIHQAHLIRPWDGIAAFTVWHVLSHRAAEYWEYLNPTFLFGREVFGPAMAPLMLLGLWWFCTAARPAERWITLASLVAAPVAGVLLDAPRTASLALMYLPVGMVLVAAGVEMLRTYRRGRQVVTAPG